MTNIPNTNKSKAPLRNKCTSMNSKSKAKKSEDLHCDEVHCESCYWFVASSGNFGYCHANIIIDNTGSKIIGFDTPRNEIRFPMVCKDNIICSFYRWEDANKTKMENQNTESRGKK